MSTPVKPPGGPPTDAPDVADATDASDGQFRAVVEGAARPDAPKGADGAEPMAAADASRIAELDAQLTSSAIDADTALDRLVTRAMIGAAGLPEAERRALETRLRQALQDDPTLLALRRDLERASAP